MKIAQRQLPGQLRGGLARAYLVAGEEPLLVDEALSAIRAAARQAGFLERELHVVDRGFKWAELGSQADNLSLFASRRLLELRLTSPRLGDAGSRAARELLENLSEDQLLLIGIHARLDAATARLAWVKSLEREGVRVEVWPIERRELPRWVTERARRHGIRLNASAVELLAERAEGNLLAVDQELIKLALLKPGGEFDEAAVAAAVGESARFDVFRLTDALLAGDARRALRVLTALRSEGTAPPLVTWALAREIGTLASVRFAVDAGADAQSAMRSNGIWPRRQPLAQAALRRLSRERLVRLLRSAALVDTASKGAQQGPGPWEAITELVVAAVTSGPKAAERR
ncbi:MAG: DNA polymerase III subunit delta [Gammaproteobacteria bacterium]